MYKYNFTGKLEPENLIVDFNLSYVTSLESPDFGIKGDLEMKVAKADIEIIYKSDVNHLLPTSSNLETLKNIIQEAAELAINLYGYVHSLYLDVYLLNVKCDILGIDFTFGIKGERNLNKSDTQALNEFNRLVRVFGDVNNFSLKDVFSDFHKAIKYAGMTAQFCFRAIETIRTNYYEDAADTNNDTRRKNGWLALRAELGFVEADFTQIVHYGIPNRHGIYPPITYPVRQEIMNFTRELIDKFVKAKLKSK